MRKAKTRECVSLEKTETMFLLYCKQTRQVGSGAGGELLCCMNESELWVQGDKKGMLQT